MTDITEIMVAIDQGDPDAAERLLPLVYAELRKLAAVRLRQERASCTLEPTDLVHEAYLRLVKSPTLKWDSRGHFFAAAAESMRRILINRARDRRRQKRGGGWQRVEIDDLVVQHAGQSFDLLALNEAIDALAAEQQVCADLVKLRFFAGLSHEDAAAALGLARRTADRHWAYARAWLFAELEEDASRASG